MHDVSELIKQMRLMLGRLGCGGGPLAFLFSPLGGLEALILQETECDQRHQRMPMQPPPRAALEVIEPELFLELLVGLLANPTRFDRRGQPRQRRIGRQVGQVVLVRHRQLGAGVGGEGRDG